MYPKFISDIFDGAVASILQSDAPEEIKKVAVQAHLFIYESGTYTEFLLSQVKDSLMETQKGDPIAPTDRAEGH